uniref:Uncharacterized protein n=1 Tax=Anguilla anguilla TaxID=7936 RepID=A0A0E9S370_ANGAN
MALLYEMSYCPRRTLCFFDHVSQSDYVTTGPIRVESRIPISQT